MALGRYVNTLRAADGQLRQGMAVSVYVAGTADLATLYRDAAGAAAEANPTISDVATAQVDFYATAGNYDLKLADGTTIAEAIVVPSAVASVELALGVQVLAEFFIAGALSAAAFAKKVPAAYAATITGVRLAVGTAPVDAAILVDVNKAGTTIFTTQANRPTIADGASSGGPGAAPNVTTLAAGDLLTVDVDQIGSGTAGSNLAVQVLGTRA